MAQINLAPGSQYIVAVRRRRRVLYGLTGAIIALAIIIGVVLSVVGSGVDKKAETVRGELHSVETHIAAASEQVRKIKLFENRLTNIENLLAGHRVWTTYLQEIERLLPGDAELTSLNGTYTDRTIELTGTAATMDTIAVALATLQNQAPGHTTLFKGGTINNVAHTTQTGPAGEVLGQRYTFKITLSF